jgi:GntR family transcriptional regulator
LPTIPDGRLRADQRPLYVQASEALRNLVQSGGYAPGDRLPSEIELSQHLGISRPTLREAMRLLEEQGAVLRRHGVGTFVATPPPLIEGGLEVLESIDRMAERCGLSTRMGESSITQRPATPHEMRGLALDAGIPHAVIDVTVVTRVILAGSQHVAFLTDVVPVEYLREDDLRKSAASTATYGRVDGSHRNPSPQFHGSVLDLFLQRGWPTLAHSRTELAAEAANAELARWLHLQRKAPLLRLEAQLYAQDGRVVDYSTSYFVPGHFRFHVIRQIT